MKSLTGKFSSVRGWALLLALLLGAGMMISACGEEETPAPTTPTPAPPPAPAPEPEPTPEPTGPATPERLRVTASSSTSITWSWNAVEGAVGYQGQFSTDATFTDTDQTFIIVAPATSHTVSNLSGNTTGHFRVRSGTGTSLTDLTYSEWTDGVPGTTAAPPTPPPATALSVPTGLSVTARGDNDVTLGWNSVRDADHYEVQQRASGGTWTDASCGGNDNEVDALACQATGLDEATSYSFRVRAVPASDDNTLTASDWTELAAAVSTTGTPPRTTVPGSQDDLNMVWESKAASITWIWDQVADRESEYQLYFHKLAAASTVDTSDDDPCPKPTAAGMWGTNTFNTRIVVPNTHTDSLLPGSPTTTLAAGDVALLCVQTTWLDDRDVRQYGNLSWAWAATQPKIPGSENTPVANDNTETRLTTSLDWPVELDKGFDYEVRVLSAKVGDGLPDECADGTAGTGLDSTAHNVSFDYTVRNPARYTEYQLCFRATNDDGESEWNKLGALSTLPGAPPRPQYSTAESDITTTGRGTSATHAIAKLVWTVSERADQPRLDTGYEAVVVVSDDNSVTAAEVNGICDLDTGTSAGTADIDNTVSGIEISVTDSDGDLLATLSSLSAGSHNIYACVRSMLATDARPTTSPATPTTGAWAISGRQVFRKAGS